MADFLSKLAGRTLGTQPSPRPVIATMFAAGPSVAGDFMSETVPHESPADDSLSSLTSRSARQEQPGLATRPEGPGAVAPGRREFVGHPLSGLTAQQSAVTDHQQVGPGSITPHGAADFSPIKESPALPGTRASIAEKQPGARLYGSHREPRQTSEPAPVIKVSIGRVDVRAVTQAPSTTPQKPPSARPQPSLEEYLHARNRGKR